MKTVDKKGVINIKVEQYQDYKHIYMLNGLTLSDDYPLYKYMPYNRLVSSVNNSELVFVSPETWTDPFERRFWKTDYSRRYDGFIQPDIACMCLTTKSTTNEEASWKMYANSQEKALRVSFAKKTFFDILEKYAQNNGCKVYIGKAIYLYDRYAILQLHKQNNIFFPLNNFSIEHYLTLMCLKRKSFAFENEIRVFIIKEKLNWDKNLIRIPATIDKNLISRIMIGPLNPFTNNDPRKSLYNNIQKLEEEVYKEQLNDLIKGCSVQQSQLYTDKKPLTII